MPRKVFTAGEVLAAADVNEFLQDQAVMTFASTAARGSAIPTPVEGMMSYIEDSNTLQTYNGTSWLVTGNAGSGSFSLVDILYFTSSGTFTKATYPWLRAIKVMCQGGGGGGANRQGTGTTSTGAGGSGGGYAESFITTLSGVDASVTVTRGAGGAGGAAGAENNGADGGASSFGSTVIGDGGQGTSVNALLAGAGSGGTGDLVIVSTGGVSGHATVSIGASLGGSSHLGGGGRGGRSGGNNSGQDGRLYGGGGGGSNGSSAGGDGANGIVIIELYA